MQGFQRRKKFKWEKLLTFRCPQCKGKLIKGRFYSCAKCNFKISDIRLAEIREDFKYRKQKKWW